MTRLIQSKSSAYEIAQAFVEAVDETDGDGEYGIEIGGEFVPVQVPYDLGPMVSALRRAVAELVENERNGKGRI